MLRNYFRLISRILFRNKVYSLINILGFSIGLAGFILIILFVRHELVYDKFYADHDRIYRVTRSWYNDDGEESLHLARVAAPVGALLAEDYPHILDEVVRVLSWDLRL